MSDKERDIKVCMAMKALRATGNCDLAGAVGDALADFGARVAELEAALAKREAVAVPDDVRAIIHAAFHLVDDAEEDAQTGAVTVDESLASPRLREISAALYLLGIESCEDIEGALEDAMLAASQQAKEEQ